MPLLQGKALAELAIKLGPIILDASQILRKWLRKETAHKGDLAVRVERLEKNLELQAELNEQFISEMKILKPASESIQRSLRMLSILVLIACILSLASLIIVLVK